MGPGSIDTPYRAVVIRRRTVWRGFQMTRPGTASQLSALVTRQESPRRSIAPGCVDFLPVHTAHLSEGIARGIALDRQGGEAS